MGRGQGQAPLASGPARHVPVLLSETVAALEPIEGGGFLDGTFGAGGYSRALLEARAARVLGIDRDPAALIAAQGLAQVSAGRFVFRRGDFSNLDAIARDADFLPMDGIALDVGVSSMQFDEAARGFSFRFDGPLDMRMSQEGATAADLVNGASEERLADIFYHYGEERASRRIARAIGVDRKLAPFDSTKRLADLIARVAPSRGQRDIHPATKAFQGLRIAVNDELGALARALLAAERALAPGGRLAVVTFHSREDRIVKRFFAERGARGRAPSRLLPGEPIPPAPTFSAAPGQPVAASSDEIARNPRARSAKLRHGVRLAEPARAQDEASLLALAGIRLRETGEP